MTVASLDSSWYRSVNEFARDTGWAHGVLANYANWAGLVLLALLAPTIAAAGTVVRLSAPVYPIKAPSFVVHIGYEPGIRWLLELRRARR